MITLQAHMNKIALLALMAFVAGCTAVQSPTTPLAPAPQLLRSGSSILPDAGSQKLIYVSDVPAGAVYIYSSGGRLVSKLSGFLQPTGLCSDTAGNVYATDSLKYHVVEYAHGGTSPIRELKDRKELPFSCAVNKKNGDLAVINNSHLAQGASGGVAIYKNAGSKRILYSFPEVYHGYFGGYDDKGNLFADATDPTNHVAFFELPAGAKSFTMITLNQTLTGPGGVQWDGKYITVGDSGAIVIYQVAVSGSKGSIVSSTPLGGASNVWQYWIGGGKVTGANAIGSNGDVLVWRYPAGGNPIQKFGNNLESPFGLTVSVSSK